MTDRDQYEEERQKRLGRAAEFFEAHQKSNSKYSYTVHETENHHKGTTDTIVAAWHPEEEEPVGVLRWSSDVGGPNVHDIRVVPNHRNRGVSEGLFATALRYTQSQNSFYVPPLGSTSVTRAGDRLQRKLEGITGFNLPKNPEILSDEKAKEWENKSTPGDILRSARCPECEGQGEHSESLIRLSRNDVYELYNGRLPKEGEKTLVHTFEKPNGNTVTGVGTVDYSGTEPRQYAEDPAKPSYIVANLPCTNCNETGKVEARRVK